MDEKPSISKNSLFDIFKNNNEAALRSPTPSHLLNRSGNSAFKTPPFGSTPVNYNNIPLHLGNEHLFLSQQFHNTSANDYDPEENFPSFSSSVSTSTILSNLSPSSIYSPHSQNLGHGFAEATIIPGNSLQNPLSFSSFQPNLSSITGTFLGSSYGRMENQPKHPIRPFPVRGVSPQLHYTRGSFSKDFKPSSIVLSLNDNNDNDNINNDSIRNIDNTSLVNDNSNSPRQDEEIKMVSLDNEDLESISYQYDFEIFDKSKQVIQESQSNQIEPSEDDKCLELVKWHLKIISIKDIPVSEIPEGIIPEGTDFWMILSGIVNGTRDKWHSGAVIAREHNRRVQTAKDKSYILIGKLSAKKMKADGFSEGLIKAFEDGFPENWRELLLADLKSLNDEISLSFKERCNLREENSSREKRSNSEEESAPQKDSSRICEEQSEVGPLLEENVSHVETPEKKITPRLENKSSSKRRFKTPDQKQGSIVTSSGRLIRAPGNWWEIKPVKPEPNVKEEPKRRRLSKRILLSTEKNTPPPSSSSTTEEHTPTSKTEAKKRNRKQFYRGTRKRRASRKGNTTGNKMEAFHEEKSDKVNAEKTTVDMPRHEVYVLVETAQILPALVADLLSYEEEKYNHVLKTYFTEDAVLTHPILNVQGRENIRKVFRVWTSLNKQPPEMTNKDHLVFNGITAVINVNQLLCPRIFPFLHFAVPSVTVLRFREGDDGLFYIYKQEDNWTLEGLIRSVPLINWWYENVVRAMFGNMVTNMGSFLATANIATSQLTIAANHINQHGGDAVVKGQHRAYKYGSDMASNVTSVFSRTIGINFGTKGSDHQHYITNGEASLETS